MGGHEVGVEDERDMQRIKQLRWESATVFCLRRNVTCQYAGGRVNCETTKRMFRDRNTCAGTRQDVCLENRSDKRSS